MRIVGTGLIRSDDNLALSILRQIEEEGVRRRSREVLVKCPVGIANFIMNQKRDHVAHIEQRYGLSVRVEGDPMLVSPDFTIEKFKTATRIVAEVAPVVSADTIVMDQVDELMEEVEEAEILTDEAEEERKPKNVVVVGVAKVAVVMKMVRTTRQMTPRAALLRMQLHQNPWMPRHRPPRMPQKMRLRHLKKRTRRSRKSANVDVDAAVSEQAEDGSSSDMASVADDATVQPATDSEASGTREKTAAPAKENEAEGRSTRTQHQLHMRKPTHQPRKSKAQTRTAQDKAQKEAELQAAAAASNRYLKSS